MCRRRFVEYLFGVRALLYECESVFVTRKSERGLITGARGGGGGGTMKEDQSAETATNNSPVCAFVRRVCDDRLPSIIPQAASY